MRVLWIDAGNGAAGDMLLAALLDAGADLGAVRAGLRGLGRLGAEPLDVTVRPVRRHGLAAALAEVHVPPDDAPGPPHHRHEHGHEREPAHQPGHEHDHEREPAHQPGHAPDQEPDNRPDHNRGLRSGHHSGHDPGHDSGPQPGHEHDHQNDHEHGHGRDRPQGREHGRAPSAAQGRAEAGEAGVTRNLDDITAILTGAELPAPAREFALAVFERLAHAEARVHGTDVSRIHFHEVGALDAIADITGCALALHSLGLLEAPVRVVSPVAAGSGTVRTAHGPLPVPPPAVLELLRAAGAPLRSHPAAMELCTPTGAALLAELATGWGPVPDCVPRSVGTGAGRADPAGHPNVLRVVVGEAAPPPDWATAELRRLDSSVDDLDPRLWPDVLAALRAAGAADAWCTPALMPKGRPGHVLSVLVDEGRLDAVCRVVFEQTTTLGVRVSAVERRSLRRDRIETRVAGVPDGAGDGAVVGVKRGYLGDRIVTVQPEYEEARAAAVATGRPLRDVMAEAARRAADHSEHSDHGEEGRDA
ncbi:nickel pincer cofactor biosynthesis protein LarC [Streptomyces sp. B6B3]|uniref:nickel pincer cofactor biosynthesis protein LarC n=1 Tax=Streptomyces sp. B6B3 TaxID=3153570 RepID=UPI00325C8BB6